MQVSNQQQHQQGARDDPVYRRPQNNTSAQQSEYRGYPMLFHDHVQRSQHDTFTWHQHLPQMSIDPLPIVHSSSTRHQGASVSIEEEMFEARMLQEALQDRDTSVAATQLNHHQHSSSFFFQRQSFEAHLILFSSQSENLTAPSDAPWRSSLSQADTLRNYVLQHQHQQPPPSPLSYSSASSSRSPVLAPANVQGHTPPSSSASSDETPATAYKRVQPRKRVQTARICQIDGCTRGIRSRGLCKAHGGGRRCTTPGCTTSDQGGGHCVLHGGGRRCIVDGCMKSVQWRGLCKLHGGARRCRYGDCIKNGQVKQGYCRLHYNLITRQRLESLLLMVGQEEGQVQAGDECKKQLEHCENGELFTLDGYQQSY